MRRIVPSRALEGIAGLIESYGEDPERIAASVGLDSEALYRTDMLVDPVKFNGFMEMTAQTCGDRFFTLKLAQIQGWDILGPIWLLIRSAQTVGEALTVLVDHLELHSQALSAFLLPEARGASICVEVRGLPNTASAHYASTVQVIELSLAICCYELRRALGKSWRPQYVRFRHAEPEDKAPLERVFGDVLYFNQDVNAIHVSRADCDAPLARTSDINRDLVERKLDTRIDVGLPFVLRVDRVIRLLINGEGCSVGKVADALSVNARTMQYRLKQHNTSYQALYDSARMDLARHYLSQSDLSVAAITERLYFTDAAAFSRFFKAKTGQSPRNYAKLLEKPNSEGP